MEIVVSSLVKERRNLVSRVRDHEAILQDMKRTLVHIDHTLRHLGYYPDGTEAPKKNMAAGLFYTGELPRIILSLLREHSDGLPLKDILHLVCVQKGWDTDHHRFNKELRLKISRCLDRQKLKGVVKRVGDEAVGVWKIR